MPPPQPDQYQQLVAAQAQVRDRATAQATALAVAAVAGFTGWYSTDRITQWAADLAKLIEAFQRGLAQSTDAYMARALSNLTGRRVRPVGRVDVAGLRAGVTHAGAYGRAADVYRWQQHQFDQIARDVAAGKTVDPVIVDPVQAAQARVAAVADMDMQLVAREQARQTMETSNVPTIGYRRVIHPEVSKGGTCGLCIAASDRLYYKAELMPVHARCACTVLPILEGADPGSVLNDGDLGRLYGDAGSTARETLKATRYRVDEHGELGPVLTRAGAPKGPPGTDGRRRGPRTDEQRAAAVRRVRDDLRTAEPAVQRLSAAAPQTWSEYADRLHVRIQQLDELVS